MLTEAAITKVLTSIASKVGYDLTKLGAGKVKELFQKEGHTITEAQAEEIVHQMQTGDLIQQINNGSVTNNNLSDNAQQFNVGDNATLNFTQPQSSEKK